MEFTNYKCPVCDIQFTIGDDIVVCPECGTPHHRECYESEGHCYYEDRHSQNFSFDNVSSQNKVDNDTSEDCETIICPSCKAENPKEIFYCNKCGYPLNIQDKNTVSDPGQQNQTQNNNGKMPPYGMPFPPNIQQINISFDPMAGFKNDEPIGENVTAGEMSKFVGKNTQYYLRVFGNIKHFNKSRYNFSAFLFSGIYFLYRKMIGLGILFSMLVIGFTVCETLVRLTPQYQSLANEILNIQGNYNIYNMSSVLNGFSVQDIVLLYLPIVFSALKGITMIICGFIANRSYYKHCIKKINFIKNNYEGSNINEQLEKKGGVNLPLAICIAAAYISIIYIPLFI